jgi:hypothetical protein
MRLKKVEETLINSEKVIFYRNPVFIEHLRIYIGFPWISSFSGTFFKFFSVIEFAEPEFPNSEPATFFRTPNPRG